jgi:hypothetical protein
MDDLIRELSAMGCRVATFKHHVHGVEVDVVGPGLMAPRLRGLGDCDDLASHAVRGGPPGSETWKPL